MAGGSHSHRGQPSAAVSFAGLRRFFRWWGRELLALVPASLRPLPKSVHGFLWVEVEPSAVRVKRFNGGRIEEIGSIDRNTPDEAGKKLAFNALCGRHIRRLPVGLVVPADQALRKTVTLPMAARENLRRVLGFELSRHTPFNAEHAWFDYREEGQDAKRNTVDVRVTVASRQVQEGAFALLAAWGHAPKAVVPATDLQGEPHYANLLPPHLRPGTGVLTKVAYGLAVMVPLLLLAATLILPLWQKREVFIALDHRMAQTRAQALAIDPLRQDLDRARAEHQFLLEKKVVRPSAVAVIEEVTKLLPDDTWLNQIEIKGREVVLSGETNASSGLIRLFEKSSLLEGAGFRSPLVKGRNNVERFQLAVSTRETNVADVIAAQQAAAEKRQDAPSTGPGKGKKRHPVEPGKG